MSPYFSMFWKVWFVVGFAVEMVALFRPARGDTLSEHPVKNLTGIWRELEFEEPAPHFLLRATQVHDGRGAKSGPRQQLSPKLEHFFDGFGDIRADTQEVSQIDQAVSGLNSALQFVVKRRGATRFATNCADCPDAVRACEARKNLRFGNRHARENFIELRLSKTPVQWCHLLSCK